MELCSPFTPQLHLHCTMYKGVGAISNVVKMLPDFFFPGKNLRGTVCKNHAKGGEGSEADTTKLYTMW